LEWATCTWFYLVRVDLEVIAGEGPQLVLLDLPPGTTR
jgi:hypothetical protein